MSTRSSELRPESGVEDRGFGEGRHPYDGEKPKIGQFWSPWA